MKRLKTKLAIEIILILILIEKPEYQIWFQLLQPLIIGVSILVWLMFKFKMVEVNTAKVFFKISLVCLISCLVSFAITEFQLKSSVSKADSIVKAINKFENENKRYPKNINELCPKYLGAIPKSSIGLFNKKEYIYHEKYLAVDYPDILDELYYYNFEAKEWRWDF